MRAWRGVPASAGRKNNENRAHTHGCTRRDAKNHHSYQSIIAKFGVLKNNEIGNQDQRILHGPEGAENNGSSQVEENSSGRAERSDPHRPGARR
jgi:hypothetical protein